MNTEFFIAQRILKGEGKDRRISRPIINIAIIGISLGLTVMILAVAIVSGFKAEIRNKVTGFGAHVLISNYDLNQSYEIKPIDKNQDFYYSITKNQGIKHIQRVATKPGIIKTKTDIQGIILKGVDHDYDWTFFDRHMEEGTHFSLEDTVKSDEVVISKKLSSMMKLKLGDHIIMYFVDQTPRLRKFIVKGIYKTSLEEFDKVFVLCDIRHVQKLNDWTENQIGSFEILLTDFNELEEQTEKVNSIAGLRFNTDGSKLKVMSIKEKEPILFDWIELFDMNVWTILVLMVIVAGVNMVSGLLILILEHTNMIGILKALGAENRFIRRLFLYKSGYLVGKGLLFGNLLGISLCLLQYFFGLIHLDPSSYYVETVPIEINVLSIVLLNLGTLFITLSMLILPSFVISRISPIKAIRFN